MPLRGPMLAFAVALTTFAGCASPAPAEPASGDGVRDLIEVDLSGAAAIEGRVVDVSLAPIEGASVLLDRQTLALTNETGGFSFRPIEPGPHDLVAFKDGYLEVYVAVDAVADRVRHATLTLDHLPSTRPYYETRIFSGQIDCNASVRASTEVAEEFPCAPTTTPSNYVPVPIRLGPLHNVTGVWSETTWRPTQTTANGMYVTWYVEYPGLTLNVQLVNQSWGPSPVRFVVTAERIAAVLELRDEAPCTMDECNMVSRHKSWGRTLNNEVADAGLMIEQRFDQFVTLFHNEPVPVDFTALPDA